MQMEEILETKTKINFILDDENRICGIQQYPVDVEKPIFNKEDLTISIDDLINGEYSLDINNNIIKLGFTEKRTQFFKSIKLNELRAKREPLLKAFDIYKSNVEYGIIVENDTTHIQMIEWYNNLLNLEDIAFENIPEGIMKYL